MSSQTSPINNRLRISRGWNTSYFPQNKNEYSRNVSLWLKLYLLIKVYLELKNFKLVSCELKFTNNNRKILFLNLFKCLKEKKKKKNKSKIQHSFKFPLQRLSNKKAIYLIYKNLKKIKKINNLKYSSVLFYQSKYLWLKKSPLLKKLLINNFRRSIIKFIQQQKQSNTTNVPNNKDIFNFLPHIILKQQKQLQFLEKNYVILSQFYTQLFFNKLKKKPNQFKSSYWLLAEFLSNKLKDIKLKINKLKITIERIFKRKTFYKKKKAFYFIQKIRLRLKKKLKSFIYLTHFQNINSNIYSKLVLKKNTLKRITSRVQYKSLKTKKVKQIREKKNKKQYIRLILNNKKKQILLFNIFFNYLKYKRINNYINLKNIKTLKHLMAAYIGYYSFSNVKKKRNINSAYSLIYKNLINSELRNLFSIHKIPTDKYTFTTKVNKKKPQIKNKLIKYFNKYQDQQLTKLITLSFKAIKRKLVLKTIKQKKIKKVWGIFKQWNKKNNKSNKIVILNRHNHKFLKKGKTNKFKLKKWNNKKVEKKISKQSRQKYFSYKRFLVQFKLQNLIKEYIFKYFQLSCIIHVTDVISKFKNSKLFYLALTKHYGPKKSFMKKKLMYSFLGTNNWRFIPTNNRLKKTIFIKKKSKLTKWELKLKKIRKVNLLTKFKFLKNKKQMNDQKWATNKEKKAMFRNIKNKSLLARFLPILALFSKDLDPKLLAQQIARELEGTKNHWPVIYTIRNILRTYQIKKLRGYRIGIYGKINSSDRTRLFYINSGRIPIQTFSEQINYASAQSRARAGTFGIKIWIF